MPLDASAGITLLGPQSDEKLEDSGFETDLNGETEN